jgi:hypothetical protein
MAISSINIGILANDGTGDDLREAFIKVNNNFTELDARQAENTTATNRLADDGTTKGVFAEKVNDNLIFKNLKAGPNVSLSADNNQITITSSGIVSILFTTDQGSLNPIGSQGQVQIQGTNGAVTSGAGSVITIDSALANESNPTLAATLDADGNNFINVGTITGNNFNGLVKGVDIDDLDSLVGFDFGGIQNPVNNMIQWLESFNPVNMGTITAPAATGIDFGSI